MGRHDQLLYHQADSVFPRRRAAVRTPILNTETAGKSVTIT